MSSTTVLHASAVRMPDVTTADAGRTKRLSQVLLAREKEEEERRLRSIGLLGRVPLGMAPRYTRTANELERAIISNNLEHRLSLRASPGELMSRGVLHASPLDLLSSSSSPTQKQQQQQQQQSGINSDGFYVVENEVADARDAARRAAEVLEFHLRRVANAEGRLDHQRDLEARRILMTGKATEHEIFADRQRRLERAIIADCLEHKLSLRPSPRELLHRSSTARRSSQELLAALNSSFRADDEEAERAANEAADAYYEDARAGLERGLARARVDQAAKAAKQRAMDHRRRRLSAQLARDNLARSLAWDEEVRRQRYEQITSQRSSIDAEAAEAAAAKVSLLLAARAQLQDQGNGKASGGGQHAMELAARQRSVGHGVATSLLARSGAFGGGVEARAKRRRELEVAGVVRSRMDEKARQLEKGMAGREVGKMLRQRAMEGGR